MCSRLGERESQRPITFSSNIGNAQRPQDHNHGSFAERSTINSSRKKGLSLSRL
jgi:hypothetical protein